jgi:hypothetical protein
MAGKVRIGGEEDMLPVLKVAYLFLSLDNKVDKTALRKIDELGNDMDNYSDKKDKIIGECEDLISQSFDSTDRYDVIFEGINKIVGNSSNQPFGLLGHPKDYVDKKQCLWILVNLAYFDGSYTDSERKLIRALVRKWEIDKSILIEMEDTAETLIELNKHKTWIKTTNYPYDYVAGVIKEMDKNQEELSSNISLLMSIG